MKKSSSVTARVLAVSALVGGFLVIVIVFAAVLGGGSEGHPSRQVPKVHHRKETGAATSPATYVVKEGDTLIAIAHKTGVGVAKIERLNPEVDPQILIAGERLKLR
jgi:LysM repeat protein